MRTARFVLVATVVLSGAALGDNRKPGPPPIKPAAPPPALVGLVEALRIAPASGFVDDPIAVDGDRLAYVAADDAGAAQVRLVDLATGKESGGFDLAPITPRPKTLAWVGARLLVTSGEPGAMIAALVEPTGKVVYRTPAATRATLVGNRVVLYRAEPMKGGTRHRIEVRAAGTGKRVGAARTLDTDASGKSEKLDFRINHWSAGMTRAIGIKGGTWTKATDQRSPDVEAVYDVVDGKFVKTAPITDLVEQRKRFALLADAGADAFARASADLSAIELWQDGAKTVLELDQPLLAYGDPRRSLDHARGRSGPWIALQIDPVNVEAVKRQKADAEYWDLFEVQGTKAVRRARRLATGQRLRFGWANDRLWILERAAGFDRGGKALVFYTLR